MDRIENFAAIPAMDQIAFATKLVKTLNSEKTFHDDAPFELTGVEPDDLTGGLTVYVDHTNLVAVIRKATWTCDHEDEAEDCPAAVETDFENFLMEDAKKAFKTLETSVEGYKVTLEVVDVDVADKDAEVEVDHISHEDAGIGDYEYFGFRGTDSQPYVEVTGTLTYMCECQLALFVESAEVPEVELDK